MNFKEEKLISQIAKLQENHTLLQHFSVIKDPRIDRGKHHKLIDIITIAICAVICGADGWTDMEMFGNCKFKWFKTFLELPYGIPSHDTFSRVFSLIPARKFNKCFMNWVEALSDSIDKKTVSFDGKTLRRSFDKASGKAALHLVRAWSSELGMTLGQVKTREKSNEITAIPKLIDILELEGSIISIDAMGCQKEIASQIRDKKADYVLALKGNQKELYEDVKCYLDEEKNNKKMGFHKTVDGDHGRIETRSYWISSDVDWLNKRHSWKDIKSIGMVESRRCINGKTSIENRYYITSLAPNVSVFANSVRKHWEIENSLHWVLDVAFREDDCRIRNDNAAQNFALLRTIALNLLKNEKTLKVGVKAKRSKAGWDETYLLKVLSIGTI